ncbi:hypothetical protein ASC80_11935 [Afipia sp. Root123D2]|nr:hypothetical protein ASC80_11935 [Afipia sp. Root123D2]
MSFCLRAVWPNCHPFGKRGSVARGQRHGALWIVGRARRFQPEQEAIRNGALDRSRIEETLKRGGEIE